MHHTESIDLGVQLAINCNPSAEQQQPMSSCPSILCTTLCNRRQRTVQLSIHCNVFVYASNALQAESVPKHIVCHATQTTAAAVPAGVNRCSCGAPNARVVKQAAAPEAHLQQPGLMQSIHMLLGLQSLASQSVQRTFCQQLTCSHLRTCT
jgi:hypothetical protein